jgi:hypothetical protein
MRCETLQKKRTMEIEKAGCFNRMQMCGSALVLGSQPRSRSINISATCFSTMLGNLNRKRHVYAYRQPFSILFSRFRSDKTGQGTTRIITASIEFFKQIIKVCWARLQLMFKDKEAPVEGLSGDALEASVILRSDEARHHSFANECSTVV